MDYSNYVGGYFRFTIKETGEKRIGKLRKNQKTLDYYFEYAGSKQIYIDKCKELSLMDSKNIIVPERYATGTYCNMGKKLKECPLHC